MIKEKITGIIKELLSDILKDMGIANPDIIVETPPDSTFGDLAFPMFKFSKELRMAPALISAKIQERISGNEMIARTEVKGPYINVFFNQNFVSKSIIEDILSKNERTGEQPDKNETVLIEFSCPNTNKPLHLGHCRNNTLGDSMARIYKKAGYNVNKVNLINDRGIHICKSMIAYDTYGNGTTPQSVGKKSDHFVGDYYVRYAIESDKNPDLEKKAQEMLVKWEAKDEKVVSLWKLMNKWAIDGIKETYKRMKISFDNYQFESETYLYGKDIISAGLEKGVFYKEPDNSIWVNNEDVGLDKKIVLRSDGTSIYITQDIGTAVKRHELFKFDRMIYVVGSEQIYHFQTLFEIFKKLGYEWASKCYHLSYGMVNLPEGKMKSREGKVIDADNLMDLLFDMSYDVVCEKHPEWSEDDKRTTADKISLGALKYYLLNFTTTKDVMFIPEKSISFDGNTGPYLQYVSARINSLLVKAGDFEINTDLLKTYKFEDAEWQVVSKLTDFDNAIIKASNEYSPLEICSYLYELSKLYNKMYHDHQILNAEKIENKIVRLMISKAVYFVKCESAMKVIAIIQEKSEIAKIIACLEKKNRAPP